MTRRRPKSQAIFAVRTALHRMGLDLVRDPFRYRFMHLLGQRSVTEVLDVGANAGQFGDDLRACGYTGRIVSVEPLRDPYDRLVEHVRSDPRWQTERAAVSRTSGTLTMNVSANSVSSSALPILDRHTVAAPSSEYVAREDVPATTVDDLVARHRIDPAAALLKVDVQGYEMPVFEGAAATLSQFAMVRTELSLVSLYEGQALLPEVVEHLRGHGLALWSVEPGFTEPQTRRMLQVDGVFVREEVS
jgi:FkbM family methyltransferase